MRSSCLLAASVAALASATAGPAALAQTPLPPVPPALDELVLAPDEEVVVREYILRRAPAPARFEREVILRPGSVVPDYVELAPMSADSDPRLRRFGYFVSPNDKIVVVDPNSRAVVRILDR